VELGEKIKQARLDALMAQQQRISRQRNTRRSGEITEVLIESANASGVIGRSYAEAPDVDGRIILPNAVASPGTYRMAKLNAARNYDMIGELV